jgi:hypothetical protein
VKYALLSAGIIGAAALGTAAQAQGITFTREVHGVLLSDYVFRGVQRSEETVKLGGDVRFDGFHAGALLIQPFNTDDFADEARLFASWSPHVEDKGSPIDYELGFTYYLTPDGAPGFPSQGRIEPYAKLFFKAPLMPSLAGYYDVQLQTYTVEGKLSQMVPLGAMNTLELGVDGGYVSPDGSQTRASTIEHAYAQGSVDFVHNFLDGLEGYVGVRGAVSSEDTFLGTTTPAGPLYDKRGKAWVAAGFTKSF